MIARNDARRITVTSILVNHSIRRGKAVFSVTCSVVSLTFRLLFAFNIFSSPDDTIEIHFPMNGTVVLSLIPQQTPGLGTQIRCHPRHSSHFFACSAAEVPVEQVHHQAVFPVG